MNRWIRITARHVAWVASAALLLLGTGPVMRADDDLPARKKKLEKMTDAEKRELLRKQERFDELPEAERNRLRKLYEQIQAQPDKQRLLELLSRYAAWLKTLTPSQRAELARQPLEQRLQQIKSITQEQERQRFRQLLGDVLKPDDRQVINQWVDAYIDQHKLQILEQMPQHVAERLSQEKTEDRDRRILWFVLLYKGPFSSFGRPSPLPTPSAEAFQQLRTRLSHDAQRLLSKLAAAERDQALRSWIRVTILARAFPPVDDAKLYAFLETLDPKTREWLEAMPASRRNHELKNLYYRQFGSRFRGDWSRGRGGSGPRGRGPGEGKTPGSRMRPPGGRRPGPGESGPPGNRPFPPRPPRAVR